MKHSKLSYPRYNFAQVFGLMWMPLVIFPTLMAFLTKDKITSEIIIVLFYYLPVVLGFYYQKSIVKSFVGFILLIPIVGSILNVIHIFFYPELKNQFAPFGLSVVLFSLGTFLLMLNKVTAIEFRRMRKKGVSYKTIYDNFKVYGKKVLVFYSNIL